YPTREEAVHTEPGGLARAGARTDTPPRTLPFHPLTHFAWLRTRLAADRTLMSWIRTSLSLIALGLAIYEYFDEVQQGATGPLMARPGAARTMGLAVIVARRVG